MSDFAFFAIALGATAYAGWTIPSEYDSLIAKLVVWAPARDAAIARLRRAIDEYVIEGVPTTLPLLRALCDLPAVADATYGTATLEAFARDWHPAPAARESHASRPATAARRTAPRLGSLRTTPSAAGGDSVLSPMHGVIVELRVAKGDRVIEGDVVAVIEAMKMMNEIRSHKRGVVTETYAAAGAAVEAGSPLLSLG